MAYPDDDHARDVCKVGEGAETCRYLASCGKWLGWSCEKKSPLKRYIDRHVDMGEQSARGDNCKGLDWR